MEDPSCGLRFGVYTNDVRGKIQYLRAASLVLDLVLLCIIVMMTSCYGNSPQIKQVDPEPKPWDTKVGDEQQPILSIEEILPTSTPTSIPLPTPMSYHADDLRQFEVANTLQFDAEVSSVAFYPDGTMLMIAGWDSSYISVWDVETGKKLHSLDNFCIGSRETASNVAVSPDGEYLAQGCMVRSKNDWLRIWDFNDKKVIYKYDLGYMAHAGIVEFFPNGHIIATGALSFQWNSGVIELRDISTGKVLNIFGMDGSDNAAAYSPNLAEFSPDGKLLAGGERLIGAIFLWEVESGSLIRRFIGPNGHPGGVSSIAFSPDSAKLASTASDDSDIRIWRVYDGALLHTLKGHSETVRSVAFSPDGSLLASGSSDNSVRLWDVESGTLLQPLSGHRGDVNYVTFSPSGHLLASGSDDMSVILWFME